MGILSEGVSLHSPRKLQLPAVPLSPPPLVDRDLGRSRKDYLGLKSQRAHLPVIHHSKAFSGARQPQGQPPPFLQARDFFTLVARRDNPYESEIHMQQRLGFRRPQQKRINLRPLESIRIAEKPVQAFSAKPLPQFLRDRDSDQCPPLEQQKTGLGLPLLHKSHLKPPTMVSSPVSKSPALHPSAAPGVTRMSSVASSPTMSPVQVSKSPALSPAQASKSPAQGSKSPALSPALPPAAFSSPRRRTTSSGWPDSRPATAQRLEEDDEIAEEHAEEALHKVTSEVLGNVIEEALASEQTPQQQVGNAIEEALVTPQVSEQTPRQQVAQEILGNVIEEALAIS